MRTIAAWCALSFALAACSGTHTVPADQIVALDLALDAGASNAVRVGLRVSGPSADVLVDFEPVTTIVRVCALPSVDAPLPDLNSCEQIASGVRQSISGASALGGIAVVNRSTASAHLTKVFVEYDEAGRTVAFRLPRVDVGGPACQDEGCNPTFERTPLHNGAFTATASWTGGDGVLGLLQGSVRGRSQRATGVPYRDAASASGASPLSIEAEMSAPGEYALVLRQDRGSGLRNVRIDAVWP